LIGVIGQRTRVYELMRRDRSLSLNMIRNLHEEYGIPADALNRSIRRKSKVAKGRRLPANAFRNRLSAIRKSA